MGCAWAEHAMCHALRRGAGAVQAAGDGSRRNKATRSGARRTGPRGLYRAHGWPRPARGQRTASDPASWPPAARRPPAASLRAPQHRDFTCDRAGTSAALAAGHPPHRRASSNEEQPMKKRDLPTLPKLSVSRETLRELVLGGYKEEETMEPPRPSATTNPWCVGLCATGKACNG
jgi:hypothetical protein